MIRRVHLIAETLTVVLTFALIRAGRSFGLLSLRWSSFVKRFKVNAGLSCDVSGAESVWGFRGLTSLSGGRFFSFFT